MGYEPLPRYVESSENRRSAPDTAKDYPLICFTGRPGPMYVHDQGRTLPWIREMRPEPEAMVNTLDADKYGIADGDLVTLASLQGCLPAGSGHRQQIRGGHLITPGQTKH